MKKLLTIGPLVLVAAGLALSGCSSSMLPTAPKVDEQSARTATPMPKQQQAGVAALVSSRIPKGVAY